MRRHVFQILESIKIRIGNRYGQRYGFLQWRLKEHSFCSGKPEPFRPSTNSFLGTPFMLFLVSQEIFYLSPIVANRDAWLTKAQMEIGLAELSACTVRGKRYVFEGRGELVRAPAFVHTLKACDYENNQWELVGEVPTERTHKVAVADNGKCYVMEVRAARSAVAGPLWPLLKCMIQGVIHRKTCMYADSEAIRWRSLFEG